VLAVQPRHAEARWQLGLIQGFEGDFDGSVATLQQVAAENPGHVKVLYDLGMTQMMLGMIDEACANFQAVLKIDPTHSDAQKQLAYCQ
jgi:protein O-mannosyl-transferase